MSLTYNKSTIINPNTREKIILPADDISQYLNIDKLHEQIQSEEVFNNRILINLVSAISDIDEAVEVSVGNNKPNKGSS